MRVLFLDDDRKRHEVFKGESIGHTVTHVETADRAIQALKTQAFDIVCLDHDLDGRTYVPSEDPSTGYQVASWMKHMDVKPGLVVVHSFNRIGAERMLEILKSDGFNAYYVPFSLLTLRNLS